MAEFICISPVRPTNGTPVDFYIDHTSADLHAPLVTAMSKTPYGKSMSTNFPLLRDIISRVVPTSAMAGSEHIDNHSLVCVATSHDAHGMVFTLVRHRTALDTPMGYRCVSVDNLPQPSKSGDYLMRAMLRVCTTRGGSRYIHHLTFPNAGCQIKVQAGASSDATQPNLAWLRLLGGFGISDTNAFESKSINTESWERFCVRNAHMGMSVAMAQKDVKTTETVSCDLDIRFTYGDVQHRIVVDSCMLDNTLTDVTNAHVGILRNFDSSICKTQHKISLNNGAYELVFSTKHPSRVRCSLLNTTTRNSIIASSDVNFSNNMVYTNVSGVGIDNVFGMQRLALRVACRLQANLTPEIVGQRLASRNFVDKNIHRMLQLISSTDIANDIGYVFRSHDKSIKFRNDDEEMNKLRLKLTSLTMKTHKNSKNDVILQQKHQFSRSPVFVETRATSSSCAERPRWQDGHTTAAKSDHLMRQKMMSARGVAALLYTNLNLGVNLNTCVVFSTVKVPKMIYKEPKCASGPFVFSKRLNWVKPLSVDAMRGCDSDKSQIPDQFMYSFNKSSKELRVFNRQNDAEKTERTFAIFVNAESTLRDNAKIFVPQGVPKGSLVGELINCCETHSSVYTRALAHLVLLDSMYRLDLISTKTSWDVYAQKWLNTYRTHFLSTLSERGVATGVQADQQYIDYCIFNQCLKQHINGTRMPCDSFSLLVQQGIPFPYV
ncbi:hypothetical protein T484DRAFT_1757696 [Baffinella frigidus]|nr:hypothetical protein T484DRAFT_1757696 [Cryptophyta sp. CCMP2293]